MVRTYLTACLMRSDCDGIQWKYLAMTDPTCYQQKPAQTFYSGKAECQAMNAKLIEPRSTHDLNIMRSEFSHLHT